MKTFSEGISTGNSIQQEGTEEYAGAPQIVHLIAWVQGVGTPRHRITDLEYDRLKIWFRKFGSKLPVGRITDKSFYSIKGLYHPTYARDSKIAKLILKHDLSHKDVARIAYNATKKDKKDLSKLELQTLKAVESPGPPEMPESLKKLVDFKGEYYHRDVGWY